MVRVCRVSFSRGACLGLLSPKTLNHNSEPFGVIAFSARSVESGFHSFSSSCSARISTLWGERMC